MKTELFTLFFLCALFGNAQFSSPQELNFNTNNFDGLSVGSSIQVDDDVEDELLVLSRNDGKFYIFDDLDEGSSVYEAFNSSSYSTISLATALDVDGDEDDDILVLTELGFFLYRNDDGEFIEVDLPGANQFRFFELYDIDQDGFEDILALNGSNSLIRAYFNNGAGSFNAPVLVTDACENAKEFTILEANGSSAGGIVFSQNNSNALAFIPFVGGENFGEPEVINSNPFNIEFIEAGDLTGDGIQDLVMVTNELIFYSENQGSNNFGAPVVINYQSNGRDLLVGDFTGDGANDVVYIKDNFLDRVILYENVSDGFFFQSQTFDAPNIQSVGEGDFDGNGMPDLAFDAYRGTERVGITFNFFSNTAGLIEAVAPTHSKSSERLVLFPNPVKDAFRLSDESIVQNGVELAIYDLQGRLVKRSTSIAGSRLFDVSDLPRGTYQVVVTEKETGIHHQTGFVKD